MAENKIEPSGIVIGIDASRNRSGGAKVHLIGILTEGNPLSYGIIKVHVWAYRSLLDSLPEKPWLIKHNPPELEGSIYKQLWWQRFSLKKELKNADCQIVLNTDAGTVGTFSPAVTMSRDMLSYEPGEIERFGFSRTRLRLILLRFMQNRSLRQANGAIFLTRYAAGVIQKSCGVLSQVAYIPHGVGANFKAMKPINSWPAKGERPFHCLYISPVWLIKHQWVVVRAIESLRKQGHDIRLTLIGGGGGGPQDILDKQLASSDPKRIFVSQKGFVPHKELPNQLSGADIFIFASSCENMPNSLVEAMAVGLPIACSNRGPMPEVLEDGGVYFDPEDHKLIANAVERIITDEVLRVKIAEKAKRLSDKYSWSRCSNETFSFIVSTLGRMK
jgi:glycosyltransferase involved in cell wall biosynthesis